MSKFTIVSISTFVVLSSIWLFTNCKKETAVVSSNSLGYFPTDNGRWIIYDVDSVYHGTNDNDNDDSVYTFHYQVREVIDSGFTDIEGRQNETVKRYQRSDSSYNWNLTSVWTQC